MTSELKLGRALGRFAPPFNSCQTFAQNVIQKCSPINASTPYIGNPRARPRIPDAKVGSVAVDGCIAVDRRVFLRWAIQTAWLGSFPDRDKAKYSMWAALQLGAALVFAVIPLVLWVRRWRRDER